MCVRIVARHCYVVCVLCVIVPAGLTLLQVVLNRHVHCEYTSLRCLFLFFTYDIQVHLEAARLLAFTEDEFMKTLDWKV